MGGVGLENSLSAAFGRKTDLKIQPPEMWFFARADIPDNIYANNPCPDSWGLPAAYFSADRVPASMFKKLQMIINTTICGDWAGNVLPDNSQGCSQTCSAYVQDPSNFDEAYWAINGIYIYDGPSSSGIDVDVSASGSYTSPSLPT